MPAVSREREEGSQFCQGKVEMSPSRRENKVIDPAHQFDNMSMMGETIQESSLKFLISRDLYPVSELDICSDDERQSFVKFRAKGEQRLN